MVLAPQTNFSYQGQKQHFFEVWPILLPKISVFSLGKSVFRIKANIFRWNTLIQNKFPNKNLFLHLTQLFLGKTQKQALDFWISHGRISFWLKEHSVVVDGVLTSNLNGCLARSLEMWVWFCSHWEIQNPHLPEKLVWRGSVVHAWVYSVYIYIYL